MSLSNRSLEQGFSDEDLLNTLDLNINVNLEFLLGFREGDKDDRNVNSSGVVTSMPDEAASYLDILPPPLDSAMSSFDCDTFNLFDPMMEFSSPGFLVDGDHLVDARQQTEFDTEEVVFDTVVPGGQDFTLFDSSMDLEMDMDPQLFLMDEIPKTTRATSRFSSAFTSSKDLQSMGSISRQQSWSPFNTLNATFVTPHVFHATPTGSSPESNALISSEDTAKSVPESSLGASQPQDSKWIFITSTESPVAKGHTRVGSRRGQLPPKARKRARRIREIGACWKCAVQKVPCSEGTPCETCLKHFSGLAKELCWRTRLVDFVPVFFPDYLCEHLGKRNTADFMGAHSHGFLDKSIDITISAGNAFEPMRIQASVFRPKTWELLGHYHLVSSDGGCGRLVERYSAPVGVANLSDPSIKIVCRKYVEQLIESPHFAFQVTAGHRTSVVASILEATKKYDLATKKSSLVHKALMLYTIHYLMGVHLSFTEKSRMHLNEQIDHIGAPEGDYVTSRLLNRQIKHVMHLLHKEIYQSVLEGLEKSLKSNSKKDSWGASFSTLLVLCLCVEELQAAADTFILSDLQLNNPSIHYRKASVDTCTTLEEGSLGQCISLFHDVYRSGRQGRVGNSREGGLNPFRSSQHDKIPKLDAPTENMVATVQALIGESYDELVELAARPAIIQDVHNVDLAEIKLHNHGRITAKFLLSFLESEKI